MTELFVTAEAARRHADLLAVGRAPGVPVVHVGRGGGARARRDRHPAGHGGCRPPARRAAAGPPRPAAPARRRPRLGARPGQRRHRHPHRRRRGRRRCRAHRRRGRPVQRQVASGPRRQPVPPADRPSVVPTAEAVDGAARAPGWPSSPPTAPGTRPRRPARLRGAGGADRLAVRQRGVRAARTTCARSPTPSSGCRSTAGPSGSTSPPPPRSASTPRRVRMRPVSPHTRRLSRPVTAVGDVREGGDVVDSQPPGDKQAYDALPDGVLVADADRRRRAAQRGGRVAAPAVCRRRTRPPARRGPAARRPAGA